MTSQFTNLFQPLAINGKTVENRVAVPPMAYFGATGEDCMVNDRHVNHYGAFAHGGAGMVVIEACSVTKMREPRNIISLFSDESIPGMSRLAKAATANQAMALVQLINLGIGVMPEASIAQISRDAFLQYKADFISAALRCMKAGFEGVQLHAAHGFYLNQVVETSTRTDEYGGCFENRVRLVQELIGEIKALCGSAFIVSVRFGSRDMNELQEAAKVFETAGADILDISTGMADYHGIPKDFPYDGKIYAASQVAKNSGVPVVCVGHITSGRQAEQILADGHADMVAVGRGHLCDPAWADKTFSGAVPNPCRNCRMCLWFVDGRKYPALA